AIWEDIPHNHDHGAEWKTDENNHWKECDCGDKANVGAHEDENGDGKCDTCEYAMGEPTPDPKPAKKKGCGSFIGGGSAALFAFACAGAAVLLKKKKRD
ncbi:MAG: hypothetical protein IJB97_09485, partial [Clostridia bacterium]|nr:hypothetical protein [Clostridia bacterium]